MIKKKAKPVARPTKKRAAARPGIKRAKTAKKKSVRSRRADSAGKAGIKKKIKKSFRKKRPVAASRKPGLFATPSPDKNKSESGEFLDRGHRLQKVLAAGGFGSRRNCEELITSGRVEVDRKTVTELGTRVKPMEQEVRVDGVALPKPRPVYIVLFKPRGVLCTNRDQQGRTRAIDLVPDKFGRLFTIGRLDLQSEGLILLSNDGMLSERLTHPSYGIEKTYRVQVLGLVENETLRQLKEGVYLAEGFARVSSVIIKKKIKQSTVLDIVLEEGMNREIRRVLARLGHKVVSLMRISVGPIKIGKMMPGEYRPLTATEVAALYRATEIPKKAEGGRQK